jgi:F420-non-reducing hydrogenase iron-sulfur subunit
MNPQSSSDIIVFLCKNCVPQSRALPIQWSESGAHVRVKQIPCSGKIDMQYILHAFEGGVQGVVVVACAQGACTLAQGNYRAKMRVQTVQRLLGEIGLDPESVQIVNCAQHETLDNVKTLIGDAVGRIAGVGTAAN